MINKWTCTKCDHEWTTAFCPDCGAARPAETGMTEEDKTSLALMREVPMLSLMGSFDDWEGRPTDKSLALAFAAKAREILAPELREAVLDDVLTLVSHRMATPGPDANLPPMRDLYDELRVWKEKGETFPADMVSVEDRKREIAASNDRLRSELQREVWAEIEGLRREVEESRDDANSERRHRNAERDARLSLSRALDDTRKRRDGWKARAEAAEKERDELQRKYSGTIEATAAHADEVLRAARDRTSADTKPACTNCNDRREVNVDRIGDGPEGRMVPCPKCAWTDAEKRAHAAAAPGRAGEGPTLKRVAGPTAGGCGVSTSPGPMQAKASELSDPMKLPCASCSLVGNCATKPFPHQCHSSLREPAPARYPTPNVDALGRWKPSAGLGGDFVSMRRCQDGSWFMRSQIMSAVQRDIAAAVDDVAEPLRIKLDHLRQEVEEIAEVKGVDRALSVLNDMRARIGNQEARINSQTLFIEEQRRRIAEIEIQKDTIEQCAHNAAAGYGQLNAKVQKALNDGNISIRDIDMVAGVHNGELAVRWIDGLLKRIAQIEENYSAANETIRGLRKLRDAKDKRIAELDTAARELARIRELAPKLLKE